MPTDFDPIVGTWYQHRDQDEKGQKFQVVSVEEADRSIEIQLYDGSVSQLDFDDWYCSDMEAIEAPEDWTAPMDQVRAAEEDPLEYTGSDRQDENQTRAMRGQPRQREAWQDRDEDRQPPEDQPD